MHDGALPEHTKQNLLHKQLCLSKLNAVCPENYVIYCENKANAGNTSQTDNLMQRSCLSLRNSKYLLF